jgi:sec-independent protein translocase protein TatA
MGFLGIGTWEIVLIIVLALIIMGPGKLTETARTLGKIVRNIKRAGSEFTTAVTRELDKPPDEPPKPSKVEKTSAPPPDMPEKEPKAETTTPTDQERRPQ